MAIDSIKNVSVENKNITPNNNTKQSTGVSTAVKTQLDKPIVKDEFVKKENKNKFSKKEKILIGVGSALAFVAAAGLIIKARVQKITKLAEKIVFKKAETMEEAIEYAKKHLKIKKFDVGDDIEIANWVNEGLTNLSNKHKGKVYMPHEVRLYTKEEIEAMKKTRETMPLASMNGNFKNFSLKPILKINKEVVDGMGGKIQKMMDFLRIRMSHDDNGLRDISFVHIPFFDTKKMSNIFEFCGKFIDKKASKAENLAAGYAMQDYVHYFNMLEKNPMQIIKRVYSNEKSVELMKKHLEKGQFKEMAELEKLTNKQLIQYLWDTNAVLIKKLKFNDLPSVDILNRRIDAFSPIYHEEGHLFHQKINFTEYLDWNSLDVYKKGKVPKAAQEFHDNKDKQAIAGMVSDYAKKSPLEFVAEVYAGMINGHTFSPGVMELYDFYKGYKIAA